jgi:H+/gluconate symporter-like permease
MSKNFIKYGMTFFALLGFLIGCSLLFADQANLMQMCGKSCGITRALINIFGHKFAEVAIAMIWILGGCIFALIAFLIHKYEEE